MEITVVHKHKSPHRSINVSRQEAGELQILTIRERSSLKGNRNMDT